MSYICPNCGNRGDYWQARAEKAEADLALALELKGMADASGQDWRDRALQWRQELFAAMLERDALRGGIQALANEWESLDPDRKWGDNWRALRGLLSPTPEGPPR